MTPLERSIEAIWSLLAKRRSRYASVSHPHVPPQYLARAVLEAAPDRDQLIAVLDLHREQYLGPGNWRCGCGMLIDPFGSQTTAHLADVVISYLQQGIAPTDQNLEVVV